MKGPEHVANLVTAHLTATVPAGLAQIADELDAPAGTVPPPATVTAQERDLLTLAEWPALFVVVQRLDSLRRVDVDADGDVVYVGRYPVRVFIFVRVQAGEGDPYAAVDLLRKRYVLATREALLAGQEAARVDESTYAESYSDVAVDDNRRTIAGAWVEAVVEVEERLAPRFPTIAAPEPDGWRFDVDVEPLPHPALDG